MSHPGTIETSYLRSASSIIEEAISSFEKRDDAKLALLEEVACKRSGISLCSYRRIAGYKNCPNFQSSLVERLTAAILQTPIPFPLALSSLAREEIAEIDVKRHGAVYTDYRLAAYLANGVMDYYVKGSIVDTACGTAIILVACAEQYKERGGDSAWLVSNNIYGVDLSSRAIRGALLSLSVFLNNESELKKLVGHFLRADTLELGEDLPSKLGVCSFDYVVGNPPWERVKPSRNEYAREHGVRVSYGQNIESLPEGYEEHRNSSREISERLARAYSIKGGVDLYRAFLELGFAICSPSGMVSLFLPGGVIRSKSLWPVRQRMLDEQVELTVSVFMNHAKFFAIDSRFKFILCSLNRMKPTSPDEPVRFCYCDGNEESVTISSMLELPRSRFCDESEALGVPEVRTETEERVLDKIWAGSVRMSKHKVFSEAAPVREVDMTLDRSMFVSKPTDKCAYPLIEGRMISQFRCGCKEYIEGSGRSAKWAVVPVGINRIHPQFFVNSSSLEEPLASRVNLPRVGFCDIAGQTNERAMQAALIPPGHVCGNKVPTIAFSSEETSLAWLGIVNSFVFDWVVRRYITTTINFFILANLPLPADAPRNKLAGYVRAILELQDGDKGWDSESIWQYSLLRAQIDAEVFTLYGLCKEDLAIILEDFPLVDNVNGQLTGGMHPTRDLFSYALTGDDERLSRAKKAFEKGALPYVPNEYMRGLLKKGGR